MSPQEALEAKLEFWLQARPGSVSRDRLRLVAALAQPWPVRSCDKRHSEIS